MQHTWRHSNEGESAPKTARTDISNKYAQKSEEYRSKKNPESAKPKESDDDFVIKDLKRKVYPASKYLLPAPRPYSEQPTITLRGLMPGDSKDADPEDRRLDMSFKAEKVEFLLVARPITEREIKEGCILESVNDSAWDIPEVEDFEDAMGKATNMMCQSNKQLIHQVNNIIKITCHNISKLYTLYPNDLYTPNQVSWSSVASQTGIGAFSIRTDNMEAMETLRAAIRSLVFGSSCFESFPKEALVQKFGLSIFFPRACAHVDEDLLIEWLRTCNPGLKGTIETIECREYKKTHPVVRRRGAKIITFTGDEEFLDSLHAFPSNFPFSIKIANAYIRGGDRVKERYAGGKPQRPKISQGALRDLLRRNSNSMADAAAEAEDRLAEELRRTDIHGNAGKHNLFFYIYNNFLQPKQAKDDKRWFTMPGITHRRSPRNSHRITLYVLLFYSLCCTFKLLFSSRPRSVNQRAAPPSHQIQCPPELVELINSVVSGNKPGFYTNEIELSDFKTNKIFNHAINSSLTQYMYHMVILTGHGIYPTGDTREQRRHAWFSKSQAAPTALGIRLGLGTGSSRCSGNSGTALNIDHGTCNVLNSIPVYTSCGAPLSTRPNPQRRRRQETANRTTLLTKTNNFSTNPFSHRARGKTYELIYMLIYLSWTNPLTNSFVHPRTTDVVSVTNPIRIGVYKTITSITLYHNQLRILNQYVAQFRSSRWTPRAVLINYSDNRLTTSRNRGKINYSDKSTTNVINPKQKHTLALSEFLPCRNPPMAAGTTSWDASRTRYIVPAPLVNPKAGNAATPGGMAAAPIY